MLYSISRLAAIESVAGAAPMAMVLPAFACFA
jgi:hypothetical protein